MQAFKSLFISLSLIYLRVYAESACQPQTFTDTTGVISSPGYPEDYVDDLDCLYHIQVQQGYFISITFYQFATEDCCDHLYVCNITGDSHCVQLNGHKGIGASYVSTGNHMELHFVTDATTVDAGFYAVYRAFAVATEILPTNSCPPPMYTTNFGVIISPNWPADYPDNKQCSYTISPMGTGAIELRVVDFKTEGCCDKLKVYDGASGGTLLATLSDNNETGYIVHSTGPQMFLNFSSDLTTHYRGFSATYRLLQTKLPDPIKITNIFT